MIAFMTVSLSKSYQVFQVSMNVWPLATLIMQTLLALRPVPMFVILHPQQESFSLVEVLRNRTNGYFLSGPEEEENVNSPKLDVFEFIFLINLMLLGSQRRLEWCIEVGVLLKLSWSFFDFSCRNRKSKGHFSDDMVGRIEFWLSSS